MKKSLLLIPTALTTLPLVSCTNTIGSNVANAYLNQNLINNNQENEIEEKGSCTFVYVGKDVSQDGVPMLCRCMDMGSSCEVSLKVYERDELANQTFVGKNGFTWTLPQHTAKCVMAPVNKAADWGPYVDEMGLNEYGVVLSETLTCATSDQAQAFDPFVKNGIAEETIGHVIIPAARTAREGVQLLIDIIAREDKGNAGDEAVFIADQNECWYVELYTGHRALGVKLPNNKMFVQGNEFGLHTLEEFSPSDIIATPGYDTVPFRSPVTGPINLFDTYAAPIGDGSHRRTWRGLNLFGEQQYRTNKYSRDEKYNWMFKPVHKPGMENDDPAGVKISLNDVIGIYRDGFEDIIDPTSPTYDEAFYNDWVNHNLRKISWNTTGQIHILRVDQNKDVDPAIAAQAWLGLSPAAFTPFVPVNAAITSVSEPYSVVSPNADYNPDSMWWACRTLNNLGQMGAEVNRETREEKYPKFHPEHLVADLNAYQNIWQHEYEEVYNYAVSMKNTSKRNGLLTNYCTSVQNEAYKLVTDLVHDAEQYFIKYNPEKTPEDNLEFFPLVDIEEFAKKYGYTYERNNEGAEFKKGEKTYSLVMPSGIVGETAKLRLNGATIDNELQATYKGNKPYIDFTKAIDLFKDDLIASIDIDAYMPHQNILVWLLPTIFGSLALIGGGVVLFVYLKKKKTKQGQ